MLTSIVICHERLDDGSCPNPSIIISRNCSCNVGTIVYGRGCLQAWLDTASTCPTCRGNILSERTNRQYDDRDDEDAFSDDSSSVVYVFFERIAEEMEAREVQQDPEINPGLELRLRRSRIFLLALQSNTAPPRVSEHYLYELLCSIVDVTRSIERNRDAFYEIELFVLENAIFKSAALALTAGDTTAYNLLLELSRPIRRRLWELRAQVINYSFRWMRDRIRLGLLEAGAINEETTPDEQFHIIDSLMNMAAPAGTDTVAERARLDFLINTEFRYSGSAAVPMPQDIGPPQTAGHGGNVTGETREEESIDSILRRLLEQYDAGRLFPTIRS